MTPRASVLIHAVPSVVALIAGSAQVLGAGPKPPWIELAALGSPAGFVVPGIHPLDRSGFSVSCAGDVNGDGIDDILIGSQYADPNGNNYAGEVYIVFGGPTVGASGLVDPATLDGTNGFVIHGLNAYDYLGRALSSAGDINGDGIDDIVLGASNTSTVAHPIAGESYIVFGKDTAVAGPFDASFDLTTLDGDNGFLINGAAPFDRSGTSVCAAGDINGDGIDDILIGAPYAAPYLYTAVGESYVVFGKDTAVDGPFDAALELGLLDGSDGFVLKGIAPYDYSGRSVACAGDVNGDGIDELIIGASGADPNGHVNAGESYVVFGKDTAVAGLFPASIDLVSLDGTNGFVINGIDGADASGRPVACAGDVNGDTYDDLVICANGGDPGGMPNGGEAYIVFGGPGVGASGSLELSTLSGTNGFVINGVRSNDFAGSAASAAGDLDSDGFDDLIIGVPGADVQCKLNAGEVYVVLGAANIGASGSVNLATLDATSGWFASGVDANDSLGRSVSFGGDVNGDQVRDILIGAPFADPGLVLGAGATYVLLGPHPGLTTFPAGCVGDATGDGCTNLSDFNMVAGHFGQAVPVYMQGDLNGDGYVDTADFNLLAGDFVCTGP